MLVVITFALGLMSKPMLVTLPCVMLLLDFWPLNRVERDERGRISPRCVGMLALEKLPLLAMSAAVCWITIEAQRSSGAIQDFRNMPLDTRLANALVSYVMYINQMFWPAKLVPVYSHPIHIATGRWLTAAVILITVTVLCVWQARRRPHLIVGWLWYIGMLVPVIGLVQVGGQARADRYTYLPLIGVYIMIVWLIPSMAASARTPMRIALRAAPAVVVLAILAALTVRQAAVWKDSATLWHHTVACTGGNTMVYSSLGDVYKRQGKLEEAEMAFRRSIALDRFHADAYYNLGIVLGDQRRTDEALAAYVEAVRLKPTLARAHYNIGNTLSGIGRKQDAIVAFEAALKAQPHYPEALNNLGNVLYDLNRYAEAEAKYREAIAQESGLVFAQQGLAHALYVQQRYDEARSQVEVVLRLRPDHPPALRLKQTLDSMP
jgi:tetratricopeptide (TPR) repeat protein